VPGVFPANDAVVHDARHLRVMTQIVTTLKEDPIMRYITTTFAVAAALALASSPASAQGDGLKGTFSVSVSGGAGLPVSGDVHGGGTGTVLGLPTTVESRSYSDVYDTGLGFRLGAAYGVARNVEVFGDFTYGKSEASDLSVGNVAGLDLRAQFSDYSTRGLEGGVRMHFAPEAGINPFVALVAGVKWIDEIPATFSVPAANVTLTDTPFYDSSVVPSFGGDFGVLFAVAPRVALGVTAGLRYHTELQDLEGLAGTGLESLNDGGSRWAFPLGATLRFSF
jgi:hypothetical protein